jgi:DNA-binding CsgD family transcriptional regulator
MVKGVVIEPEVSFATIRVRERRHCAGTIIAETISEYAPQVSIEHSESTGNNWREVLVYTPSGVSEKDLEIFSKYSKVLRNWRFFFLPTLDKNIVAIEVMDHALNEVMRIRGIFQRLIGYTATPKYEEFEILLFPSNALPNVVKCLKRTGSADIIEQETKLLEEIDIPRFRFELFKSPPLSDREEEILKVAYELGWFEYPRPTGASIEDIAKRVNLSKATVDIILRNASRKLCRQYFSRYAHPLV